MRLSPSPRVGHAAGRLAWLTLLPGLALAGCLGPLEPDVGPPIHEICSDDDSDPTTDVSYVDDVLPLFVRTSGGCIQCHLPSGSTPVGITVGGLDLSSYDSMREGGVQGGSDNVINGQPCDSVLYEKLSAAPPFGSRMPLDGPAFFEPDELMLVHDWIAEGALEN